MAWPRDKVQINKLSLGYAQVLSRQPLQHVMRSFEGKLPQTDKKERERERKRKRTRKRERERVSELDAK